MWSGRWNRAHGGLPRLERVHERAAQGGLARKAAKGEASTEVAQTEPEPVEAPEPIRTRAKRGSKAIAVGLFLAVNLPILVGYALIPGSWLAEEVGVVAVAVLAIVAWPAGRGRRDASS